MSTDPGPDHIQTEAQRLDAGVYRWVVRMLVVVLPMAALALAFLSISPDAVEVVILIGAVVIVVMCIIALSYNLRLIRLMSRIGREAYLQQERAGLSRPTPLSRRRRTACIAASAAILIAELVVQIVRLVVLRR
jgi:hypothetical protein